ncbi:hypothetical protein O6H91_Y366100 [Diphasiastrum complanatum]|nr:hypothetical protein O6H91_Y366100 [Diphasiastrum complanatum]
MCEGAEQQIKPSSVSGKEPMSEKDDKNAAGSTGTQVSLLELAADNDLAGFRQIVENGARLDEPDNWYCRTIGTNKMALEKRTAVMIASVYGSVEVLRFILAQVSSPEALVNQVCGSDKTTALHCAASGGASRVIEIVGLLLEKGARCDAKDADGRCPVDVLVVNPKMPNIKIGVSDRPEKVIDVARCDSEVQSGLSGNLLIPEDKNSSSPLFSPPSPSSPKSSDGHSPNFPEGNEKAREYPVDASLPDIKNSIYTTDEFRMFSFKVRPCSRAYSHDWTECPFVHPGENARRRDPRRYHYSCVPCPDFRKGACRRGDSCEYAHGVFECWLHPAQYRTRLCKDGTNCARRVCFFAHTTEELRPLYALSSAVQSPRDSSPLELRTMGSPPLPPVSPSPMLMGPGSYSPCNTSVTTPPMSPSASSLNSSHGGSWPQPGIPTLHLPGGLHVSRLRAALNARDMPLEDLHDGSDFDRITAEFSSLSAHVLGRMGKFGNLGLSIPPTNLQDIFSSEHVSPVSLGHQNSFQDHSSLSPQLHSLQSQVQLINSLLSPRSSQRSSQLQGPQSLMPSSAQTSPYNLGSPRPISTRRVDLDVLASSSVPLSPDIASNLQNRKAAFSLKDGGSWSSRDLSGSVPSPSWSDWGSPSGKPDWGVRGHDLGKFRKSASFASHGATEPDVSWVQSLVKDSPGDTDESG